MHLYALLYIQRVLPCLIWLIAFLKHSILNNEYLQLYEIWTSGSSMLCVISSLIKLLLEICKDHVGNG